MRLRNERKKKHGAEKSRPSPWFWIFFVIVLIAVTGAGTAAGILLGYEYNLPPVQSLEDYRPDVITTIYSDNGRIIGEFAIERRIIVLYDEIPQNLRNAIIAVEDSRFYHHSGVNYYSITRAVVKDFIRQSYPIGKGASTITMQLSRMLLEAYEKTWDRKIKEIWVARKIESLYSKQQIFTLYANLHIMGPGIYGVAAAADYYFGKTPKDLNLEECALIAGLPSSPGRYSPRTNPTAARVRRNFVLDRMASENMISFLDAEAAKRRPIILKPVSRDERSIAPHFVEWVRRSLSTRYSTDEIWRKGMRVHTTLNISMQNAARRALQEGLRDFDKKLGWRGPVGNILESSSENLGSYSHPGWRALIQPGDIVVGLVEDVSGKEAVVRVGDWRGLVGAKEIAWTKASTPSKILKTGDLAWFRVVSLDNERRSAALILEQRPRVEGAIIILENSTGEIKAMVGGYDFSSSEFNRATQAMRQVGSTFKPILYSAALEKGLTESSTVLDSPVSYTDGLGRKWSPGNYDQRFKGLITIRQALAESRNVPAVKIADLIGINEVVVMARRFGLEGRLDPYLPLALGACEATPLEMASAFTVFPNLGFSAEPYFLRLVENYDRIKKEEHLPEIHRVLEPDKAAEMLALLRNVVENGTATAAKSLGRPLGGKTGTTNDFTDAWFIGFTPSLTAAVWVGYDEKRTLGDRQSGGVVALPIWIDCMREILKDAPDADFSTLSVVLDGESPIYIENLSN
ncbi:MAG: PBP1A family penicillin-binding protein [Acidobacteria bacterium]|nr:PBP1A family penicillin-binding protein [Acidobacteriota bacterium]